MCISRVIYICKKNQFSFPFFSFLPAFFFISFLDAHAIYTQPSLTVALYRLNETVCCLSRRGRINPRKRMLNADLMLRMKRRFWREIWEKKQLILNVFLSLHPVENSRTRDGNERLDVGRATRYSVCIKYLMFCVNWLRRDLSFASVFILNAVIHMDIYIRICQSVWCIQRLDFIVIGENNIKCGVDLLSLPLPITFWLVLRNCFFFLVYNTYLIEVIFRGILNRIKFETVNGT